MADTTDREKIQEVIDKSENHFEEKLTYISAGTLGLTLTFIDKIVPLGDSIAVLFLVIGWGFLVLTLLVNLSSHMISKYYLKKTQLEVDKNVLNWETINSNISARNGKIDCINWITIILLILGISSIVAFASINSIQKSSSQSKKNQTNTSIKQTTDSINSKHTTNNYFYYGK